MTPTAMESASLTVRIPCSVVFIAYGLTADNCPSATNTNQSNSDGDVYGDLCGENENALWSRYCVSLCMKTTALASPIPRSQTVMATDAGICVVRPLLARVLVGSNCVGRLRRG